jgi:hypothetical protein
MVFCDWLSIYQVHLGGVPLVNDGHVFSVDQDGEIQWEVAQKLVHRGSHDTTIRIRSDGNRITLDGNIGRFNRADNLFGYTVAECVRLANSMLAGFGLPPFTDAAPMPLNGKGGSDAGFQAVAAVITRVDLTKNWVTGSPGNCSQFIRHLQGFKSGRFEPKGYKTTGVAWGEGSKFWYAKVYDKAGEYFRQHGKKSKKFDAQLFDYMHQSGIARHEIELKSRYLKQHNLWRFSLWVDGMEDRIYALFNDVIDGSAHVDSFLEIEGRAGELAVAWRDGADLKKRLAQNTYYRYRRELLKFGIDIAVPSNITRLSSRVQVEVITLSPAQPPSWYVIPKAA